jgi:hypothetical protein
VPHAGLAAPHRNFIVPHGTIIVPHRTFIAAHGTVIVPHRTFIAAHGTIIAAHRTFTAAHGTIIVPHRTFIAAHGTIIAPHRTFTAPHRSILSQDLHHEGIASSFSPAPRRRQAQACCYTTSFQPPCAPSIEIQSMKTARLTDSTKSTSPGQASLSRVIPDVRTPASLP